VNYREQPFAIRPGTQVPPRAFRLFTN
jgi:hypothetical protein